MHRLISGEIPRPSEHAAIDPELEELIVKATAPNAQDRFATADQLRLELDGYIARAGEHCSLRQIGTELGRVFHEERQRHAELINAALRQSFRPAAGPGSAQDEGDAALAAPEPVKPHSRAPLFAACALVLLALAGFLAPKLWSSAAAPTAPSAATTPRAPSGNADATRPATATATATAATPASEQGAAPPAASIEAESASPLPSSSGKQSDAKKKHAPRGGVAVRERPAAPAPAAAPRAPAAADDRCTPPYYFVGGIKTYKPECL
jgi:hypothetical protein